MTAMQLLVGARSSPLAVVQAEWVVQALRHQGHSVELVGLSSQGDTDRRSLTEIGGTGVFATAVREALLRCEVDVIVHSLKDLPTAPAPGIALAAVTARELVNDVLVGRDIDEWDDATVIGCGSPRRTVQLQALAAARGVSPSFVSIRGNVDTRLQQVRDDAVQATVLARAGLVRLGKVPASGVLPATVNDVAVRELTLDEMLPAAGQAALAVECRSDDAAVLEALTALDHADTRAAITAERVFLSTLEAGCLAPIGVHAEVEGNRLRINAVVHDGSAALLRFGGRGRADDAEALGVTVARQALAVLQTADPRQAGQQR